MAARLKIKTVVDTLEVKYSVNGHAFERPINVWLLPSQPEKTLYRKKRKMVRLSRPVPCE